MAVIFASDLEKAELAKERPVETEPPPPEGGSKTTGESETPDAMHTSEPPDATSGSTTGTESETVKDKGAASPNGDGGFQRRIAKLDRARHEAEQRAQALEAQLATERAAKQQPKEPAKPDPDQKPKEEDFQDWAAYQEALTGWKAREVAREMLAERDRKTAEVIANEYRAKQAQAWQEKLQAGKADLPDLDEKLSTSEVWFPGEVLSAIAQSAIGPRLAYELASDDVEANRIAALPIPLQLMELGKLEARLSVAANGSNGKTDHPPPPKPRATALPAPIKPVGASAEASTEPDPTRDAARMTPEQWRQWRDKRDKQELAKRGLPLN